MIRVIDAARRVDVRIAIPGLLGLVACTPIYDAQFNDRANELEAFRTEFQPEDNKTSLITSGGDRVFWVDKVPPQGTQFLRSMIPGDPASQVEYEWSKDKFDTEDYHFGEQLIGDCDFGTSLAYEVTDGNEVSGKIAQTSRGASQLCAIDGRIVYFVIGSSTLVKWNPPAEVPVTPDQMQVIPFIDLAVKPTEIVNGIAGFGVTGNLALFAEQGGNLYTVDLSTKVSKWLKNDEPATGSVFFDEQGVLYTTSTSARYIEFTDAEDPPDTSFDDMVRDGGYHLNFKLADIQQPAGNGEFALHDRHVVYRGERGIFAYGLDTHNVIDLLLDRGEGIDLELAYHSPAVTKGGQLFVIGGNSFGIGVIGPAYQVDLRERLR